MADSTMDFEAFLASTVEELAQPIFDGSWVSLEGDVLEEAILKFATLHKFVGKLRQAFDDTLTTEQAKGNLSEIEHIRKPREKSEVTQTSMADFVKKLK
jgi:hypothetical protein